MIHRVMGVLLTCVLILPGVVLAQTTPSGIAGLVRDTSGGVLPGVTVEASSPALIEKVRTVVTDGEGRYNIVDLRPGAYVVTFSLAGFNTLRREGIELAAGFTATANVEMQVGALEETITVTGAAPLVDTQNTRQQKTVSAELLTALPTSSKAVNNLIALTPGLVGPADVGGSSGIYNSGGVGQTASTFHGKTGTNKQTYDGMRTHNMQSCGGGCVGYIINAAAVEETTIETGGASADSIASGLAINMIPKEGGNTFSVLVSGLYTNASLQSENLDDALRARGLTTSQKVVKLFDLTGTLGGPIKKDKLWFFTAQRGWGNRNQVSGIYWNKTQGTPFYTPDLERPWIRSETAQAHTGRVTWQVSTKNKVSIFGDLQVNRTRGSGSEFIAPEAVGSSWNFSPQGLFQVSWSSPRTNRLLLEAGMSATISHYPGYYPEGVTNDVRNISILETATGFRYNSSANIGAGGGNLGDTHESDRFAQRLSLSYVTGSHVFKSGFQLEQGRRNNNTYVIGDVSYSFLNGAPISITQYATPYLENMRMRADLGLYAQDQWSINRLTLNYGLRFDYFNSFVPAQKIGAGPWIGERNWEPVNRVPEWTDLSPRVGASYDVFGNGKTAVKGAAGKYVSGQGVEIANANNPMTTSVNNTTRSWIDANGNFAPDCNLANFAPNGECGTIDNQSFGKLDPRTTQYAEDVLHGFGRRDFVWDISAEVQHEVRSGISLTAGYYRNWYNNFRVTDNRSVTPGNYSTYCVPAPKDPRLPGGGGYDVCGLYDINPDKFGQVSNLVTQASNFGKQTQVSNFFNLTANSRFRSGIRLGGGVDTGQRVDNNCFVIDSPQQLKYCRVVIPSKANMQVKLNGSLPLPGKFTVAGILQNTAGPGILANYPAPSALIAPSLGRPLAGGVRTATVPLIEPNTQFEKRRTQLDLRVMRAFSVGSKARLQANFDLYNVLNANSVLGVNTTYGSSWLRPTSILDGRLIEFGGQLTF